MLFTLKILELHRMWLNQLCLKRHLRKWQNVHKMNPPWLSDTASDQLAYRSWLKVYRKLWSKLTYLAGSLFPTLFQSHMMIGCLTELGTDRNQRKFHKEGNPLKGMMQWDWWYQEYGVSLLLSLNQTTRNKQTFQMMMCSSSPREASQPLELLRILEASPSHQEHQLSEGWKMLKVRICIKTTKTFLFITPLIPWETDMFRQLLLGACLWKMWNSNKNLINLMWPHIQISLVLEQSSWMEFLPSLTFAMILSLI